MQDSATRIDLPDMIVTAEADGEAVQPWSGKPSYRYSVSVSARGCGPSWVSPAYGSQHDYEQGDNGHAEEMAWMVLNDLLSAWDDPEEFFQMALGEPDLQTLSKVRGVLSVIDYAEKIGETLEANRESIAEGYEQF